MNSADADNPDRPRAGFSLIEIVYVVLIVGIMAMIAAPHIDFERVRVDSAAMQLSSKLLFAQRLAVLRQHDIRVVFDTSQAQLVIHMDADNDGQIGTTEQTETNGLDEGVRYGLIGSALYGSGGAVTFKPDASGRPAVVFHRNGSASEEGAVHLTSLSPTGPQHDRAIRVVRATGVSRCFTRSTGSWKEGC